MRRSRIPLTSIAIVALSLIFSGCATSTRPASDKVSAANASRFSNILVIGVADDYEGRSQFERKLTAGLRTQGATATALYAAVGGNKPIERDAIRALIEAEGYDSVLISRVLNRDVDASLQAGAAAAKTVRKDGGAVDLFRYDYVELNQPATLNMKLSVTISTELFAAADNQRIWAIESAISNKDTLVDLINEATDKILRRLKRDKLIGP